MESHEDLERGAGASAAHASSPVRTYLAVGVVLAVSTVIEVQLPSLLAGNTPVLVVSLLLSAFFKAGLVMLFYMHLKDDSRAYTGIVALALVLVTFFLVLLTMGHLHT